MGSVIGSEARVHLRKIVGTLNGEPLDLHEGAHPMKRNSEECVATEHVQDMRFHPNRGTSCLFARQPHVTRSQLFALCLHPDFLSALRLMKT